MTNSINSETLLCDIWLDNNGEPHLHFHTVTGVCLHDSKAPCAITLDNHETRFHGGKPYLCIKPLDDFVHFCWKAAEELVEDWRSA